MMSLCQHCVEILHIFRTKTKTRKTAIVLTNRSLLSDRKQKYLAKELKLFHLAPIHIENETFPLLSTLK